MCGNNNMYFMLYHTLFLVSVVVQIEKKEEKRAFLSEVLSHKVRVGGQGPPEKY